MRTDAIARVLVQSQVWRRRGPLGRLALQQRDLTAVEPARRAQRPVHTQALARTQRQWPVEFGQGHSWVASRQSTNAIVQSPWGLVADGAGSLQRMFPVRQRIAPGSAVL